MRATLTWLDYAFIAAYLVLALVIGARFARRTGEGSEGYFVGDRKLPWWIAGTSIVATTFAADTPLAVTGIVALDGISGNWIWWSWAIAHLSGTFFFARLWRRSGVITDAEITELRYGGSAAAALRATKAVYFGLFINCLTMAWVIAAMVKISRAFFDVDPSVVIAGAMLVSVLYTSLGGFRGVVVTDLVQFTLGMSGALVLAGYVLADFGGLGTLPEPGGTALATGAGEEPGLLPALARTLGAGGERALQDVLDFVPRADHPTLPLAYFLVLLIAGWWRYAEGNGYLVQRLAACKDEGHAQGASLWFAVAHNAIRPWPWILVGLASLVVYPRLPGTAREHLALHAVESGASATLTPSSLDVALGGVLTFQSPDPAEGLSGACTLQFAGRTVPLVPGADGVRRATLAPLERSGVYPVEIRCEGASPRSWRSAAGSDADRDGLRVELRDREMAYPLLMGRYLPAGLLGLVIASLLAAFMSTIDTHTNWGASYLVRDIYLRFVNPQASDAQATRISRGAVVLMALIAGTTALFIDNIAAVWRFLVALGAGLGSVSAARWYWSRVTPHAEFAALWATTLSALFLELSSMPTLLGAANPLHLEGLQGWMKILLIAVTSLLVWVPTALLGPANDPAVLERFVARVQPSGPGWRSVPGHRPAPADALGRALVRFAAGLVVVFGSLFGLGELLVGSPGRAALALAAASVALAGIVWEGRRQRANASPGPLLSQRQGAE